MTDCEQTVRDLIIERDGWRELADEANDALQRAEQDRDHWQAEAERCHEALIDAGQRLDAAGRQ